MAKKEKEIIIPNKTSMNLYQVDNRGNNVPAFLIGLVVVALVAFLIAQFGVIARLNKLNKLENEVAQIERVLDDYHHEMEEYPVSKENYLRYSDAYSKNSIVYVDRIEIMDLLENACRDLGNIISYSIVENSVSAKVNTASLEDFNKIKANLDASKLVDYVTLISSTDVSDLKVVSNVFKFTVSDKEGN